MPFGSMMRVLRCSTPEHIKEAIPRSYKLPTVALKRRRASRARAGVARSAANTNHATNPCT